LLPQVLGGQSDSGWCPYPSLKSTRLHLSMASGLDGVTNIMVIANLVMRWWTLRGKLVSSFLPGLGALGPWMVKATAKGIITASTHQWGVCVGAVPVDGGVGWDGRESVAQHREVELSACCSRATQRCHLASCSHSLVFRSSVLEMSSNQQVVAAMLLATQGKRMALGAPCGRHHR
jgi:hypothetical protein